MKTLAFALLLAGVAAAQDAQEQKKTDTKAAVELTDAEAGTLGGFVVDKVDANPAAAELESGIVGKIDEIQKARAASTEKKDDPSTGKTKGKKKGKKGGKKGTKSSPDTLKSGLNDSDRQALGKFVVAEINADHKGQALADGIKKELERLRAERIKASSAENSQPKKKKKKKDNG